ncbi:hypothetical protein GGR58DRAFT_444691 [Xylaria digitata]|nr:hypothetical protein GGR58DRAFT_444691 [Xylaria digitata]
MHCASWPFCVCALSLRALSTLRYAALGTYTTQLNGYLGQVYLCFKPEPTRLGILHSPPRCRYTTTPPIRKLYIVYLRYYYTISCGGVLGVYSTHLQYNPVGWTAKLASTLRYLYLCLCPYPYLPFPPNQPTNQPSLSLALRLSVSLT